MGSLAGGRGWGSSNTEESVVDPEEESVEESLEDSSPKDSPGSLFLFWVGGLGALLGCRLGGRWGLGLGFGAVWGARRGVGVWGCTGGAHAGGGGGGPLLPLVGSAAALGTGRQCCPDPRCASRERCRGLPRSPSWP